MIKQVPNQQKYTIQKAQRHRKANSVGFPHLSKQKCICCDKYVQKQSIGMCFGNQQLLYLGIQVPTYFILIEFSVCVTFVFSAIIGIPFSIINSTNNACNNLNCSFWFSSLSIFNSFNSISTLNLLFYLAIPTILLIFILFLLWILRMNKLKQKHYQKDLFPDSYACFLHLPFNNLTSPYLTAQIDSWWEEQLKINAEQISKICPEIARRKNEESSLQSDGIMFAQKQSYEPSLFVQKIIFAYDYEQFQKMKDQFGSFGGFLELDKMKKEQLNRLMELHKKKKKMSQELSKTNFCVVNFKKKIYSAYFYQRNNTSIFQNCNSQKHDMKIRNEDVQVISDLLPNDLLWQNMHLQQNKCENYGKQLLILCIGLIVGSAGWIGCVFLYRQLMQDSSTLLQYYPYFCGLVSNIWVVVFSYISCETKEIMAHRRALAIVLNQVVNNVNVLVVSPALAYFFIDKTYIWSEGGLVQTLYLNAVIFYAINILSPYIGIPALKFYYNRLFVKQNQNYTQKQVNKKLQRPEIDINQRITALTTTFYIFSFITVLSPISGPVFFLFSLTTLLLERINILFIWKQPQSHGPKLTLSVMSILKISPITTLLAILFVGLLAKDQGSFTFDSVHKIILVLLFIFVISLLFIPTTTHSSTYLNQEQQQVYNDKQSDFLQLFQQNNEPCQFQKDKTKNPHSNIHKFQEQMNTMSKTLSLSLKQQLLSRQPSILDNKDNIQEIQEDQVNHIYFEYQQKVFMREQEHKIIIPPLFPKVQRQYQPQNDDKIKFNTLFTGQEKSLALKLKKKIKEKIKHMQTNQQMSN